MDWSLTNNAEQIKIKDRVNHFDFISSKCNRIHLVYGDDIFYHDNQLTIRTGSTLSSVKQLDPVKGFISTLASDAPIASTTLHNEVVEFNDLLLSHDGANIIDFNGKSLNIPAQALAISNNRMHLYAKINDIDWQEYYDDFVTGDVISLPENAIYVPSNGYGKGGHIVNGTFVFERNVHSICKSALLTKLEQPLTCSRGKLKMVRWQIYYLIAI